MNLSLCSPGTIIVSTWLTDALLFFSSLSEAEWFLIVAIEHVQPKARTSHHLDSGATPHHHVDDLSPLIAGVLG